MTLCVFIFLCAALCLTAGGSLLNVSISKKQFLFLWLAITALSASLAYSYYDRDGTTDIYRYYLYIDAYRHNGLVALLHDLPMSGEPGRVLLFFIISKLPNNHFFPLISVATVLGAFGHFTSKIMFAQGQRWMKVRVFSFALTVFIALFPYMDMIVTTRYAIACALLCYSYTLYIQRKSLLSLLASLMIALFACTLHRIIWLVWGLFAAYELWPAIYRFRCFFLFPQIMLQWITSLLMGNGNAIVKGLAENILNYRDGSASRYVLFWIVNLIIIVLIQAALEYVISHASDALNHDKRQYKILKVMSIINILSIGMFHTTAGVRLLFFTGLFFPYLVAATQELMRPRIRSLWKNAIYFLSWGMIVWSAAYYFLISSKGMIGFE